MSALLSLLCVAMITFAQIHEPIQCEASWKMVDDKAAELRITAVIDAGWHVYSTELEDGPTAATLVVETIEGARLDGKMCLQGIGKFRQGAAGLLHHGIAGMGGVGGDDAHVSGHHVALQILCHFKDAL